MISCLAKCLSDTSEVQFNSQEAFTKHFETSYEQYYSLNNTKTDFVYLSFICENNVFIFRVKKFTFGMSINAAKINLDCLIY